MAMSRSTSPAMGNAHRVERHHTNSPPQLSKRDKRRSMLAERLEVMTKEFAQNRDVHYREQLQAIQIDMNLIMEANAHGDEPLKNSPDEIEKLVEDNVRSGRRAAGPIAPPRAGRIYADFSNEVNDAMEDRDAALSTHMRDVDVKMSELRALHTFQKKLAAGEHAALSSTLRDRLINSVTSKKNRLSKDKETVDISDSNAILLHPSQFGLANPASPGGIHTKRATRHRREADDLGSFPETNKRKRKAADSDESPGPTRQRLDNGTCTPLWWQEKRNTESKQYDSALYSIDKLFTEKELAMTYNAAALAAHSYIQRHQPYDGLPDSPPNGKSDASASTGDMITTAPAPDYNDDEDLPASGAAMERQFSHATRSTRGITSNLVTGLGIDGITDLNIPANMAAINKTIPKMPPALGPNMLKGYVKGESNSVAGLSAEEAAAEFELIKHARMFNDAKGFGRNLDLENGGRGLLEAVAAPRRFDFFVRGEDRTLLESNVRGSA